jgi:hypothetical protein
VVGALAAFRALRGAMLAAEASRLEKMPEVINEARSLGLPAEVRGRVIAAVVEAAGGPRSVQEALNAILETFNKLTPDVDAELARAYQQAATKIVGEGRVGFASGATSTEALDELKRVLKSAGVEDAKLDSYARKIAKQFADNPAMGGGYYDRLDIVILREGSPADSLAHELAHRVQNLSGEFGKLSTMRKEYQAFVAEREFLLMLPHEQVPAGFSTDLLRMTNEDIKTYVVKNYTEKILADIRSGTPFDPFDETTDGALILDTFKKVAKRSIP